MLCWNLLWLARSAIDQAHARIREKQDHYIGAAESVDDGELDQEMAELRAESAMQAVEDGLESRRASERRKVQLRIKKTAQMTKNDPSAADDLKRRKSDTETKPDGDAQVLTAPLPLTAAVTSERSWAEESGARPYDPHADQERDFIVCNHCMAHGSIWMQQSRQACLNPRCHHIHDDSVPHHGGEARWIIFAGALPDYRARDRDADWTEDEAWEGFVDMTNKALDALQLYYEKWARDSVETEGFRYDDLYLPCWGTMARDCRVDAEPKER